MSCEIIGSEGLKSVPEGSKVLAQVHLTEEVDQELIWLHWTLSYRLCCVVYDSLTLTSVHFSPHSTIRTHDIIWC